MTPLLMLAAAAAADPRCASTRTADLVGCAQAELARADAALNAAYRAAMAKAKAGDGDVPAADRGENGGRSYPQALLASQRAWLSFRDAECGLRIWGNAGGHERPIYRLGCLTELTEARTRQLRDDFVGGR